MFLEIANDCALERRHGASAAVPALAYTGARIVEFMRLVRQECDSPGRSHARVPPGLLPHSQVALLAPGAQEVTVSQPQSARFRGA